MVLGLIFLYNGVCWLHHRRPSWCTLRTRQKRVPLICFYLFFIRLLVRSLAVFGSFLAGQHDLEIWHARRYKSKFKRGVFRVALGHRE